MQGNGVKTVFYEGRHRIFTCNYVEEHTCKRGRCRCRLRSIFPRPTPCFSLNCHLSLQYGIEDRRFPGQTCAPARKSLTNQQVPDTSLSTSNIIR